MSGIRPFWQRKSLAEMSHDEWESICDGCGKCCLVKLEDEEDGTVYYTDIACKLLDLRTCRCHDYAHRQARVPSCVVMGPAALDILPMMPKSCAYRRLDEGRGLPSWHPLVSGRADSTLEAGRSVRGRAISETLVAEEDQEEHLVDWPITES